MTNVQAIKAKVEDIHQQWTDTVRKFDQAMLEMTEMCIAAKQEFTRDLTPEEILEDEAGL